MNNDTKLLVICPSRIRPVRLKEMLQSFDATKSEGTDIVVYVADDDPTIEEYKSLLQGRNLVIGRRRHLVEVLNYISCELYPWLAYYGEINDDHIYRTPGWDKVLINALEARGGGWGIACGTDHINDNWYKFRHPSACVISGKMVRTLGFFVLPLLQHMWTDVFLRDISEGIGRLYFCPEVVTEHMHISTGKARNDANYKWVYSPEQMKFGQENYEKWKREHYIQTIDKLKKAIENDR
ncbi:MAG: hypothetical protein WCI77_07925 [Candidatus Omnitrophota bacterium]